MPTRTRAKTQSEEQLLDAATMRLLRAAKEQALKTGRKLTRDALLREGYSERFIAKVEEA